MPAERLNIEQRLKQLFKKKTTVGVFKTELHTLIPTQTLSFEATTDIISWINVHYCNGGHKGKVQACLVWFSSLMEYQLVNLRDIATFYLCIIKWCDFQSFIPHVAKILLLMTIDNDRYTFTRYEVQSLLDRYKLSQSKPLAVVLGVMKSMRGELVPEPIPYVHMRALPKSPAILIERIQDQAPQTGPATILGTVTDRIAMDDGYNSICPRVEYLNIGSNVYRVDGNKRLRLTERHSLSDVLRNYHNFERPHEIVSMLATPRTRWYLAFANDAILARFQLRMAALVDYELSNTRRKRKTDQAFVSLMENFGAFTELIGQCEPNVFDVLVDRLNENGRREFAHWRIVQHPPLVTFDKLHVSVLTHLRLLVLTEREYHAYVSVLTRLITNVLHQIHAFVFDVPQVFRTRAIDVPKFIHAFRAWFDAFSVDVLSVNREPLELLPIFDMLFTFEGLNRQLIHHTVPPVCFARKCLTGASLADLTFFLEYFAELMTVTGESERVGEQARVVYERLFAGVRVSPKRTLLGFQVHLATVWRLFELRGETKRSTDGLLDEFPQLAKFRRVYQRVFLTGGWSGDSSQSSSEEEIIMA